MTNRFRPMMLRSKSNIAYPTRPEIAIPRFLSFLCLQSRVSPSFLVFVSTKKKWTFMARIKEIDVEKESEIVQRRFQWKHLFLPEWLTGLSLVAEIHHRFIRNLYASDVHCPQHLIGSTWPVVLLDSLPRLSSDRWRKRKLYDAPPPHHPECAHPRYLLKRGKWPHFFPGSKACRIRRPISPPLLGLNEGLAHLISLSYPFIFTIQRISGDCNCASCVARLPLRIILCDISPAVVVIVGVIIVVTVVSNDNDREKFDGYGVSRWCFGLLCIFLIEVPILTRLRLVFAFLRKVGTLSMR